MTSSASSGDTPRHAICSMFQAFQMNPVIFRNTNTCLLQYTAFVIALSNKKASRPHSLLSKTKWVTISQNDSTMRLGLLTRLEGNHIINLDFFWDVVAC